MERYLGTDELPKSEVISFLQRHADAAFLRKWKLTGVPKSIRKNRNCSQLVAAYKVGRVLHGWLAGWLARTIFCSCWVEVADVWRWP